MCCGTSYVADETSTCCGESTDAQAFVFDTAAEKEQDTRECCGNTLIAEEQGCCNGAAYDPSTQTCADRTSSSPTSPIQKCAFGTICAGASNSAAVCGSCSFDTAANSCFAVDVTDIATDAEEETRRRVLSEAQEEEQCSYVQCGIDESVCGTECFGPDEVCCAGKIYQRDSTRRCCGSSYLPRASGDVCCGNALHPSQPDHACCGSRYVPVPEGSVCCDGLVVDGDSCCGAQGYASAETTSICCDSQLLAPSSEDDKCCGSVLVAADQVCCEGSAHDPRDGYVCCGSEYVRADSALCCEADDGAVTLHAYPSASAKLLASEKCCGANAIPSHLACCNGAAYDADEYVCADRSSGARAACAAGRLCPVADEQMAFCDSCTFDTDTAVCGVAVGEPFTPECRNEPTLAFFGEGYAATVTGLSQSTAYEAQVEAATIGGLTRSEWTAARTLLGTLPAPSLLVLGNSSILASWSQTPSEFGDLLRYDLLRNGETVFSGTALAFEDTGLTPGTRYTYEYVAVSELTTTRSRTANATTFTSAPSGFGRPACEAAGASSVAVSWEAPAQPNGDITEYLLQRGDSPQDRTSVQLALSEVVQGLEPATEYEFRVFACTATGCSGSPVCVVTTAEAAPSGLAAPETALVGGTQLTVSWAPPLRANGELLSYAVQTRRVRRPAEQTFTTVATVPATGSPLEATFTVEENVELAVRVVAFNGAGNTSSPAVFEPKAPTFVGAPVVVPPLLAQEVTLAWPATETYSSFYTVLLRNLGESSFSEVATGTETRVTIDSLDAGQTYEAAVLAGNAAGNTTSSTTTFTTAAQAMPPSGFDAAMATATSATSAVITWSAPLVPNGEILAYRVVRSGPFAVGTEYSAGEHDPAVVGEQLYEGLQRFISDASIQPYSTYFYAVFAVNAGGATRGAGGSSGGGTDVTALTTLPSLATGLSAPNAEPQDEALNISWAAPESLNGELVAFVLQAREVQEPPLEATELYRGGDAQFRATGLGVFTRYEVRVNVQNTVGTAVGPWATATTCGGVPDGLPTATVDARSPTSIQVSWAAPTSLNGVLSAYTVFVDGQPRTSVQTRSLLVRCLRVLVFACACTCVCVCVCGCTCVCVHACACVFISLDPYLAPAVRTSLIFRLIPFP